MGIKVEIVKNETHWKTSDIGKLVRAALRYSGWKTTKNPKLRVKVGYSKPGNTYGELSQMLDLASHRKRTMMLNLPKRGPKDDPITMLATTSVSDEPVLAPSAVYSLARSLAEGFLNVRRQSKPLTPRYEKRRREIKTNAGSRVRPTWLPAGLYITRYAKPKPPVKKPFLEQVEEALGRAEARVEEWEGELEHAEDYLKRARRDLKREQKRMRDARKRAEERGEPVERIGRSHRLYGRF